MTSYVRAQLSAQNYVATTADVWSTPHRSFMGVTVHWIDTDSLCRKSLALACRRFPGSHTYDRVADILEEIRETYDIPLQKIVATVTDNATNFAKAFKEFGVCLENSDEGKVGGAWHW
ncbi:hypothetical protein HPB52_010522 [Rhipicephalus sanguineus]|uniref:Uncharacterized protein n=1 Tax=Rhipicephalus sanguineus TaxID=34632 RepID=A0A9D4Q612_RHISA|nr:hypothetical protein HPB52_010522 [Rhipicephalus sanguineus]